MPTPEQDATRRHAGPPDPSRVALGLAALGRPAYINLGRDGRHPSVAELRDTAHRSLDAAFDGGVRWFDAARSYGRAEEFLAQWLRARELAGEAVTVSSKWGYRYTADWRPDAEVHEVKDHSLAHFRSQLAETRALLGDVLALYQVHSLGTDSPLFDDVALHAELAALTDEGVRVGFSTSGPAQADAVRRGLALRVDGAPVFTSVQSTWNLLEPSVGDALVEAHDAGAHVLVKEPVANGRLVVEPPPVLATVAGRHVVGPDAVALAAALDQPWADTVLLGAADPEQVAANLRGLTVALTDDDRDQLAALRRPAGEYWEHRASLPWH